MRNISYRFKNSNRRKNSLRYERDDNQMRPLKRRVNKSAALIHLCFFMGSIYVKSLFIARRSA